MATSWPSIRNKPPIIQREFRGINKLDPFSISPEYAYDTLNLTSSNYPIAKTRPGNSLIGTYGTRVLGMGVWKDTELHAVFNDGTWRRLNGDGTWTQLASGLSTTAEWTFTNFKGNLSDICLIGANGVDSPRYYNGTTVAVLTGVPAGGKYITQFADRLWCAVGNELWASAYRIANDWTLPTDPDDEDASAWYTTIETPNGETINGIVSGLTRLTITKPSSTHSLIGYAPSDYDVRVNTLGTGQFNQKSAVTLDGWLYQLDDAGFYRFPGSGQPVNDFSERIKFYFDLMTNSDKAAAVLATDNTRIYLGLGSTLIEYDPKRNTFYPWTGISALQFAQVGTKVYIGDTLGRVLLLGGSTSDVGTPISWKLVPPTFTGQSMSQGILWKRLWATLEPSAGSTFGVSLSGNATGESWVQSGSTITGGEIQRNAYYFPSNILPPTQQIRVKFEGTGPMQLHEWARDEDYYPLR